MKDSPSQIRMGPQRAVAGGATFKSVVGTGKAVHAILSSSLVQVLHHHHGYRNPLPLLHHASLPKN